MTTPMAMRNNPPQNQDQIPLVARLFLFAFGGLLVGIAVGAGIVHLANSGRLSSWKKLEGSQHFDSVVDATARAVVAEDIDGTLYQWNFNCALERECRSWMQIETLPALPRYQGDVPAERGASCGPLWQNLPPEPPGILKECVLARTAGPEFGTVALYAILEDGQIMHWELSESTAFDLMLPAQIGCVAALVGLALGAISGILAKPPESR